MNTQPEGFVDICRGPLLSCECVRSYTSQHSSQALFSISLECQMLWQLLSTGLSQVLDTQHNPFPHKTAATDEVAIAYTSNDDHFHFYGPFQIKPFKNPTLHEKIPLFLNSVQPRGSFIAHFTPPLLSDEHNKQKWALKWWELKKKRHSLPVQNNCGATCQLCSLTSTSLSRGARIVTPDKQMSLVPHFLFCWLVLFSEQHTHMHKYTNQLFF